MRTQRQKSKILFVRDLSFLAALNSQPGNFFICDRRLRKQLSPHLRRNNLILWLASGERTKTLSTFSQVLLKIERLCQHDRQKSRIVRFVAIGGGSIGDFAGFLSSVYQRGVDLIQVPSTWLAALDSSHGGKNALNGSNGKNQIGTFYSPSKIYICRDLLYQQPPVRAEDAFGELLKIALIHGSKLWDKVKQLSEVNQAVLWQFLPSAIHAKYVVVNRDPFEKKGIRQVLNLGHTMGHVYEVLLQQPHGFSVSMGLIFAMRRSFKDKILSQAEYENIFNTNAGKLLKTLVAKRLSLGRNSSKKSKLPKLSQVKHLLLRDKKRNGAEHLTFIYLNKPGFPVRRTVKISSLLKSWDDFK